MNRRGFTLIELLAVIILVGLIAVLTVPNLLLAVDKSREASYNVLLQNIVTSSQMYYEECEYGDLSNTNKYGSNYACKIKADNTITTTLGTLANTGFLKVDSTKKVGDKKIKVVINPINNNDISNCQIKIRKIKSEFTDDNNISNIKVTYKLEAITTGCPTTEEYEGV